MVEKGPQIGKIIATIRVLKGFSQEYVADQLGVSQTSYWKYEAGKTKVKLETLQKLADVFEISVDQIINYQPAASLSNAADSEIDDNNGLKNCLEQIENLKLQIKLLQERIIDKEIIIELLKKQLT